MESRPSRRNQQPETFSARQLLIPIGTGLTVLGVAAGGTFLWQHDVDARQKAALVAASFTPTPEPTPTTQAPTAEPTSEPTPTPRRLQISEVIATQIAGFSQPKDIVTSLFPTRLPTSTPRPTATFFPTPTPRPTSTLAPTPTPRVLQNAEPAQIQPAANVDSAPPVSIYKPPAPPRVTISESDLADLLRQQGYIVEKPNPQADSPQIEVIPDSNSTIPTIPPPTETPISVVQPTTDPPDQPSQAVASINGCLPGDDPTNGISVTLDLNNDGQYDELTAIKQDEPDNPLTKPISGNPSSTNFSELQAPDGSYQPLKPGIYDIIITDSQTGDYSSSTGIAVNLCPPPAPTAVPIPTDQATSIPTVVPSPTRTLPSSPDWQAGKSPLVDGHAVADNQSINVGPDDSCQINAEGAVEKVQGYYAPNADLLGLSGSSDPEIKNGLKNPASLSKTQLSNLINKINLRLSAANITEYKPIKC